MLQDIAILTGGVVISEEVGLSLETAEIEHLGTAKKVTIGKENTVIVDGAGDKASIEARVESIRRQVEESTSDYDKENFKSVWQNYQAVLQSSRWVRQLKLR